MGSSGQVENTRRILVLFDGVCNLCNGIVQFIIKRDRNATFRFASLQSDFAKSQLHHFNLNPDSLHSIVVIDEDQVFERSDAALHIAKYLDGPWRSFAWLRIFPKFLRDAFYNLVATNRYKVFGKADNCMIPTPDLKERFIE